MTFWEPYPSEWHEDRGARGLLARLSATQLFVLSFAAMIVVGTLGYLFLPGLYTGPALGFVDALFTATSAVCVTGLIVVDTATYFTVWGQAWTLFLIQAGGLGMLTFTTLVAVALGRGGSLQMEEAAGGHAAHLSHTSAAGLLKSVIAVTLALEAAGAVILWMAWREPLGADGAVWHAVFQAVSAFCNAGFSTFSDSIVGFRGSPLTLATICGLVIVGGIGFVVIEDFRALWANRARRLTVHTRIVVVSTAVLLAVGWILFTIFEWQHDLAGLPLVDRLVNAFFMSVTPRTAGFNTVDYGTATNSSLFLTIVFMLMGGSPGSTAGGFKTTTVALLFLLLRSKLRGEKRVSVFNRTIPTETLQQAAGLVIGGLVVLGGSIFLLSITELGAVGALDRQEFFSIIFEAHSAFGTVGLSMGATPDLSPLGRLIITMLMYLGRIGPLAAASAMTVALTRRKLQYRYGEEDVIIG